MDNTKVGEGENAVNTLPTIPDSHTPASEQHHRTIQLVAFRLGSEDYALRIEEIKEVVLTPKIAKVPQTENYIRGVANIRGNILAIVDLEERFNLRGKDSSDEGKFTLVLDDREYKVGFLVRNVPNTIEVSEASLDHSAGLIHDSGIDERAIEAIVKTDDRLIILLDIKRLLQKEEIGSIVDADELLDNKPTQLN